MAGRRIQVLDVREMVRRFKLDQSDREVARDLGTNRRTVAKYRKFAVAEGWVARPDLLSPEEIATRLKAVAPAITFGPQSSVEPHREKVLELRAKGVEIVALWQILKDNFGFTGQYSSVQRFVSRNEPKTPEAFVRVETPAGEELQVDFGSVGMVRDPKTGEERRAWVFVATLSFSRHQYVEVVFDQKVQTWLALHVRTFEWIQGVVSRVVIDNLKAAITKACFHDPQVQRAYRELAEHYGFTIAPCRIETPRHKGKVESGVRYVKRNALAGREFAHLDAMNEYLKKWVMSRAGTRDHGTTHEAPLVRFHEHEKTALKPLPTVRYELAVWKQAKLHPDCHVVLDKAYYSAPHRLIGQRLIVRATAERVEIYHQHERVATHSRAKYPGDRVSNILHYPPVKVAGCLVSPVRVKQEAERIGTATFQLVEEMLLEKPVDRLRAAQGVVNLVKRYGPTRVEAACRRALIFSEASYRAVSSILKRRLDTTPLPPEAVESGPVPRTSRFARPIHQIGNF